jgi:hypothetical protein
LQNCTPQTDTQKAPKATREINKLSKIKWHGGRSSTHVCF